MLILISNFKMVKKNFIENYQKEFSNRQLNHFNSLRWLNSFTVDSPEKNRTNILHKDI